MICLPELEAVLMRPMSFKEDSINVMRSFSFNKGEPESLPTPKSSRKIVLGHSPSFKNWEPEKKLEANLSFKSQTLEAASQSGCDPLVDDEKVVPAAAAEMPLYKLISPRPKNELDECATKLQKVYKSYRTRRNLADAAVIVEFWWQALDYASLNISSVSFYHDGEPEKAVSRWSRAKKRLAKVGKGLSKDQKAQKLAIQHWLEAIDPRHRYGHNLHFYYEIWCERETTQPFFYWLDAGNGKKVDIQKCPRSRLQSQIIKYLGPSERESYEVVVVNGRLIYKKNQSPVNTTEGSKWIFVLSTSRNLYVGQKKKGTFQHSSFLAGAATTAAGRLVAKDGHLQAIWPYSGHYLPTEENFKEFISFLEDNHVDLSGVKKCSVDDDDFSSFRKPDNIEIDDASTTTDMAEASAAIAKWSTGAGPRIGCVREYPVDLQVKALEHVRLSPRMPLSSVENQIPIPSPRPSPNMRISPHLTRMGFSPRTYPADLQVMDNGSPKIVLSPIRNKILSASSCRSPMVKLSPKTSFNGFAVPKVILRLPSSRVKRGH